MKQDFENKKLILASQSPRRHSLIKKLNVDFEVAVPSFDEKLESDDYSDDKIESLSLKKALSVLDNHKVDDDRTGGISLKNSFVISADTVVVLENKILGKPKDEAHALQMLKDLSGKKHFVVTSISIVDSETRNSVTELVVSSALYEDMQLQEYKQEQEAKKYYLSLERLAGKKAVDSLILSQYALKNQLLDTENMSKQK